MKSGFLERIYSKQVIDSQMGKVRFVQRSKVLGTHSGVGVPLVITHQTKLKKIAQLQKNRTSITTG